MRRRTLAAAGAILAVGLALPGAGAATVIRSASLDETIEASTAILTGTVVSERPFRLADGRIMTAVRVRVEESLAGPFGAGELVTVTSYGGSYRGRRSVVPGAARWSKGERVLLQLEVVDGRLQTLGLALGKWNVIKDGFGERQLTRNLAGLGVAGPAMTEGPVALEAFRARVERLGRRSER